MVCCWYCFSVVLIVAEINDISHFAFHDIWLHKFVSYSYLFLLFLVWLQALKAFKAGSEYYAVCLNKSVCYMLDSFNKNLVRKFSEHWLQEYSWCEYVVTPNVCCLTFRFFGRLAFWPLLENAMGNTEKAILQKQNMFHYTPYSVCINQCISATWELHYILPVSFECYGINNNDNNNNNNNP